MIFLLINDEKITKKAVDHITSKIRLTTSDLTQVVPSIPLIRSIKFTLRLGRGTVILSIPCWNVRREAYGKNYVEI